VWFLLSMSNRVIRRQGRGPLHFNTRERNLKVRSPYCPFAFSSYRKRCPIAPRLPTPFRILDIKKLERSLDEPPKRFLYNFSEIGFINFNARRAKEYINSDGFQVDPASVKSSA
jgi:hypothetical protein